MENMSASEVINFAQDFLSRADKELTPAEKKEQKKYAIMVQNTDDKLLLSKMLDESSQIRNSKILSKRIRLLLKRYGVPEFFGSSDRMLLHLFTSIGYHFDFIAIPIFKKRLRKETSKVIIDEEESLLNAHLTARREQKIGQNVNLLGEVVLGDKEADHRYHHYLEALTHSNINYISIKLSGIYAQINPLNYEQNKKELCERVARIYQQAIDHPYTDHKGNKHSKFVNLDMEEYKDTELTLDVFKTVLSMPQFKDYKAGIVVQAYLPDASAFQEELLAFARRRVAEGGSPLKMRLVKGANLQMESIISSLKGWENPVYDSKLKVDANYLHILDKALLPENARVLNVGVASHNFFSIGYAYLLSIHNKVEDYVTFEMLEGMANHLPRVMRSLRKNIILYTPVVKDEHFLNAVSYLVRRLDENTGKENFLSYSFNLQVNSKEWEFLKKQFLDAYALKDTVETSPKRVQDRTKPLIPNSNPNTFANEPDTNFDLPANRKWADSIRNKWQKTSGHTPYQIPVQIGDTAVSSAKQLPFFDHAQEDETCICKVGLASKEQVSEIIALAREDASGWRKTTLAQRSEILHRVADNISSKRGDLIGCMSAITGKTFTEGDVEVSEAIDFCRFYPFSMKPFTRLSNTKISPKGIILVIPPWNFPLAIPVGGVAAALTGGNTVILKPATSAYPVAWEFAQCFWEAGVPKDALQLLCADSSETLNHLTTHPAIRHIILTGGTDTAFRILENNPSCPLSAETGGKNAIIVTASADRDHAIQNVVTSAFSNAGQKCSACSLLMLDKEIFDDKEFKSKLIDAVTSIRTGSPWNGASYVGPMITNRNDKLQQALNHLEEGESWLVKPEFADKAGYILRPAVKWNVRPGSFTFETELFAPLLSVVCINGLEEGIRLVNSGQYGLTSGLQSLDESEIARWKDTIEAGNLYINRGITGAIVQRQPFGGMKLSAFGGGIKAGGPNYVSCFVDVEEKDTENLPTAHTAHFPELSRLLDDKDNNRFQFFVDNYLASWAKEFQHEYDTQKIYGEKNSFRYLPVADMVLRIHPQDTLTDVLLALAASRIAGNNISVSIQPGHEKYTVIKTLSPDIPIVAEDEATFLSRIARFNRIRTLHANLSDALYQAAAKHGKYIATAAPCPEGRFELLHYLKEQSISYEYHRYGSISEDFNN